MNIIAVESSFRESLKDTLESRLDVEVLNITEYDAEGFVFGHPDQIEFDIVIKNGQLMMCEIQSSMSKSDIIGKSDFMSRNTTKRLM